MPPSDPIAAWLDALAGALSFDPALSRRVRTEVEDHFHEAVAAGVPESEALARFGAVRDIAAEYAEVSLGVRSKSAGLVLLLGILGVYLAMWGRVAWWGFSDVMRHSLVVAATVPVMRAAFWIALLAGFLAWVCSNRARGGLAAPLARVVLLSAVATAASVVGVATDSVLVGVRLSATAWSVSALLPVTLLIGEILLSAFMVRECRILAHRVAAGSRLLAPDGGGRVAMSRPRR